MKWGKKIKTKNVNESDDAEGEPRLRGTAGPRSDELRGPWSALLRQGARLAGTQRDHTPSRPPNQRQERQRHCHPRSQDHTSPGGGERLDEAPFPSPAAQL